MIVILIASRPGSLPSSSERLSPAGALVIDHHDGSTSICVPLPRAERYLEASSDLAFRLTSAGPKSRGAERHELLGLAEGRRESNCQ